LLVRGTSLSLKKSLVVSSGLGGALNREPNFIAAGQKRLLHIGRIQKQKRLLTRTLSKKGDGRGKEG